MVELYLTLSTYFSCMYICIVLFMKITHPEWSIVLQCACVDGTDNTLKVGRFTESIANVREARDLPCQCQR